MVLNKSHIRSILKSFTWRFIATLDTFLVVLFITCLFRECSIENALKIGTFEFLLKLQIFYLHERFWLYIFAKHKVTNKEIFYKTLSWRVIATITTFIISGVILEKFDEVVLFIAITELFTKFVLYYYHEKFWLRSNKGKLPRIFLEKIE